MHIFLDANSIIEQGYGTYAETTELLSIARAWGHQVHVPQVALEEVVAYFSRTLSEKISAVRGPIGQLSKFLGRELEYPINSTDLYDETRLFREQFENRLAAANVNIPQYPANSHEEIVNRATSRTRPFDEEGSGYRDTLLWFNILELTDELDGQIILVSRDNDFRGGGDSLHNHLVEDLASNGQPSDRVVLTKSVKDLMKQHIYPNVQNAFADDPLGRLAALEIDVKETIGLGIQSSPLITDWDPRELGLSLDCESTILDSVEGISNLNVVGVRQVPGDKFSVNITCDFVGTFEIVIPSADWDEMATDPRLRLMDPDWNDNGVLPAISVGFHCELDLEINPLDTKEYTVQVFTLSLPNQVTQAVAS